MGSIQEWSNALARQKNIRDIILQTTKTTFVLPFVNTLMDGAPPIFRQK
jgi:hypothetical protein